MYQVGNNQGVSHRQREGTGLAHILTGPDTAVDTYGRLWALNEAKIAKRDAAAAATKAAALKGLKEFDPEYAYQHKAEIQPLIEAHTQKGAELLARNGNDIFTATDPESVAWQKEHQRITGMAQHSMQVQKEMTALMQDLDGKDMDKITPDSLAQNLAWRNKPLSELYASGERRPPIRLKTAWQDANEFIGKNMKMWESGHAGASAAEVEDFVTSLLQQPANAPMVQAYAQKFAELPDNERTRVTNAAKDGNREVYQQLALEDGLRWQAGKEPLDFQKEMDKSATDATSRVSYSDWQQGDKSGKSPKKGEIAKQAANAAEETFNSRADWMTFFIRNGELPRGKEETDASYSARVKALLADKIKGRMKADTQYRVDKSGADEQKRKETSDLFVADLTGDDMIAANSAANLLTGTTFASNLKIEDAAVNRAPDYSTVMRLELTTPMTVSQVKQTILDNDTGLSEDQVEIVEKEGKKTALISFRPGEGGKQSAARLYDNFMKETGAVYEPKHTERETPPPPAIATPKPGTVNFDSFFKQ